MASSGEAGDCRVNNLKIVSGISPLFMLIFYLSNDSFVIQSALLPSSFLVAQFQRILFSKSFLFRIITTIYYLEFL